MIGCIHRGAKGGAVAGKRIVLFGWADSVHIQRWATGLSNRGFRIKLISLGRKPVADVETVIIPRTGRHSYVTQAARAAKEARSFEPDLVHAHYVTGYGLWAWRTAFEPTVVSAWGSDVVEAESSILRKLLARKVFRRADHVTVPSRFLWEKVLDLAPGTESRMSLVPFGVSIPDRVDDLPSVGPTRICFFKALMRRYGPDILLKALAKARESVPDIQLSIAGRGEMEADLRQMTVELGLDNNVRFVGFVDNREIYSFIAAHHFTVMPSLEESFGVAAVESAACARAVLATRVGGIPEVVLDGETGLLVPSGDVDALAKAIVRLSTDRELCRKLGDNGRERAKRQFDWEQSLDLMAELYLRLIDETKNG